jgi:GntR family transcriptional regulator
LKPLWFERNPTKMTEEKRYITLANEIRKDIVSGKYGTEGGLPTIEELVERSSLSRATVYKSLAILEAEGLIISKNRNFFVNRESVPMIGYVPPLQERLKLSGKTAFVRNLEPVEGSTLPDHIADKLGLNRGTPCVYRHRISGELTVDGKEKPTRLLKFYYLIPITVEQLGRLNSVPATDILFEAAPAKMIREDTLLARHLTSEESELLDLPESTAVMSMHIMNSTMDGQYLLVQESVFVGVCFTYKYEFENRPK